MVNVPIRTLANLISELGVPSERILFHPPPGTATEQDVLDLDAHEGRLVELVDGVLVEKTMGFEESLIAGAILYFLRDFVIPSNLGVVSGADGMIRLFPGTVRIPDVAYVGWDRFPDGKLTGEPIPSLAPDLAVEVLSRSNTPQEMDRKRHEYFDAGTRLVWLVAPAERTVTVFRSASSSELLTAADTLNADDVLPGFSLSLADLFSELDRQAGSN